MIKGKAAILNCLKSKYSYHIVSNHSSFLALEYVSGFLCEGKICSQLIKFQLCEAKMSVTTAGSITSAIFQGNLLKAENC